MRRYLTVTFHTGAKRFALRFLCTPAEPASPVHPRVRGTRIGLGSGRDEDQNAMHPEEKVKRSRWWWLPGTAAAVASFARLAYEVLRDHHFLRWR
ncbi:hypothetical protein GCM10009850_047900 [Nonomuraea monospora]|uniref:Uncharacterized protein n=1 Tax=Nonomuraea monospora TaxID=568818 RepID=A0ABN3CIU2_9ACTN